MTWIVFTVILTLIGAGGLFYGLASKIGSEKLIAFGVFGGAVVIWLVLSVFLSLHTVGQREVGIVYSFSGTITGKKNPGVVFTAPWQHIKTENVGILRENFTLDPNNSAVSSDQQAIFANLSLNYEVLPGDVVHLFKTVGPNWRALLLDSRVLTDFKEVTSDFTAAKITTSRPELRAQTKTRLTKELAPYGVKVVDFFVNNLDYTQSYRDSINAKNVQVQQALQAEAKVAQSRAEADQAIAVAHGQAESTIERARGEAEAIAVKGKALRNNPNILQLEAIDKLNPNAQVIICTGQGQGNCPSFLPTLTSGK